MTTTHLVLLLTAAGVVLAAVLNMLANWVRPPKKLKPWHLTAGISACVAVLVAVALILVLNDDKNGDTDRSDNSSAPPAGSTTVLAELAPDLLEARLITLDDSAGRPVLFTSRLDGLNRNLLWDMPDSWPGALAGHDAVILSAVWEEQDTERLELFSANGAFREALTTPDPLQSDTSPSVAGRTVFFIRNTHRSTAQGRTLVSSRLMRLSLDGGTPEEIDVGEAELRTASVSQDGHVVAGSCSSPDDSPNTGCVVDTSSGTVTRFSPPQTATVDDVAISPDGRRVAYSAPVANAYGQVQIFVHDLDTEETIMVTRLAGWNSSPAWAPTGQHSCLAFAHHELSTGSSVQLMCLTPDPITVPAIPVGSNPVWLPS